MPLRHRQQPSCGGRGAFRLPHRRLCVLAVASRHRSGVCGRAESRRTAIPQGAAVLPIALQTPLTGAQARELGVTASAARRLVREGAAVLLPDGRLQLDPEQDAERVARLGLGENAVVCLESAAVRYGWPVTSELLHLSLPRSRSRARWPAVTVSTRRKGCAQQVVNGVPTTSPETTIIDLACFRGLRPA